MDDQQNEPNVLIAWILGIAVTIAVTVSLIIGIVGGLGAGKSAAPAAEQKPAAAAAAAAAPDEVDQPPALATGPGVPAAVKLYFELGKAELPADAAAQLEPIVAWAKATPEAKFGVSGYHDASGDPAANAELAKNRAKAARESLVSAGIAADRLILVKPQQTTGGPDDQEARRVEVYPAQP